MVSAMPARARPPSVEVMNVVVSGPQASNTVEIVNEPRHPESSIGPTAAPPSLLMCAPDHYDVHFLFNPHMRYTERVDRRRAKAQWWRLVRVLEDAGADLHFLEPTGVTGPLVFTADGAFCYRPGEVLILQNDGIRGDLEPAVFRAWFQEHGFRTESAPPNWRLDGGNLLRLPDGTVLAGLKPGSSGMGERYLARHLRVTVGQRLETVPLVEEKFLHLDTVVGVLGDGRYLVYSGGLRDGRLPEEGALAEAEIVAVSRSDALRFACNTVVVGDVVVTGPISNDLCRRIGGLGFHVERMDLSEFYKAGGGAKCLALPLRHPEKGVDSHERPSESRSRATAAR
jgi:N-dimethylarginine dimethylaminohydrolase